MLHGKIAARLPLGRLSLQLDPLMVSRAADQTVLVVDPPGPEASRDVEHAGLDGDDLLAQPRTDTADRSLTGR